MIRVLGSLFTLFCIFGCTSSQTASYRYTQKQIEHGDLDFESRLRVNEYINAFPQEDLAKPKKGEDLAVQIDYFSDSLPKSKSTTLAQIAIRTRVANVSERAKKFGISLVLDNSGSMKEDDKFQDALNATLAMVAELSEGTEFALIVFSNVARVVIKPTIITRQSRETIKDTIQQLSTEGGTNIEAGLVLGYKTMAKFSKEAQSRLLLLTDGQSNVGVTDPKELAKEADVQYLEGARISTVGLGFDVDEQLLRTIAEKGRGAYYFAENAAALKTFFRKDIESLMIPIAKDVRLAVKAGSESIIKKVYGYEPPISNNSISIDVGELNSDDWRIVIVEIEGKANSVTVEATASYRPISAKTTMTKKVAKKIVVGGQKKAKINKVVARNAVIFSNAMTLIEVSKLDKARKYKEAEDIVTIQLANLEVVRSLDKSSELKKEADNLLQVKQILQAKQGKEKGESLQLSTQPSDLKPLVQTAAKLAKMCVPGPWAFIIDLIELVME